LVTGYLQITQGWEEISFWFKEKKGGEKELGRVHRFITKKRCVEIGEVITILIGAYVQGKGEFKNKKAGVSKDQEAKGGKRLTEN